MNRSFHVIGDVVKGSAVQAAELEHQPIDLRVVNPMFQCLERAGEAACARGTPLTM